jgi:dihydrofolate reductase
MGILNAFLFISLDGYFKGLNNDISWSQPGSEGLDFSMEGLSGGGTLVFGRVTYQMMSSFWPSAVAIEAMKPVADGMNNANKIVFSTTLEKADWNNTTLIKNDLPAEIKRLKEQGASMTILGSNTILTQCADHNLLDSLQIMISPVALGKGTSIFTGLQNRLNLKLTNTRAFKSGAVVLSYEVPGQV